MRATGKTFPRYASSGKQTLRKCSKSVDDFVLIDVDSNFPTVIIVDVPESVQKKLRKPSPRTVISIDDDDEVAGGDCSNDNDSPSSSRCSSKPIHYSNSAKENGSENESGSAERDCSDCECIDDPPDKLREQWELASQRRKRRKTAIHTGVSRNNEASTSASSPGHHSDSRAENGAKQSYVSDQFNPTRMGNDEGRNDEDKSFPFTEQAFGNSLNKDDRHDPSYAARAFPDQGPSPPNDADAMGTGSSCVENNSSKDAKKPHYVNVDFHYSYFCSSRHDGQEPVMDTAEFNADLNCAFEDLDAKISSEPCSYNCQPSYDEQLFCDISEPLNEDPAILKPPGVASVDLNEQWPASGFCSAHSDRRTYAAYEANSGAGLNTFRNFKSLDNVEMADNNTAHGREPGIISLHNHQKAETCYRFCYSVQMEPDGSSSEPSDDLTMNKANHVLQDLGGKPWQNDIVIDRQKIKETDEYKRAMEELQASRQRQLQIQAEEAERLRRRKRAASMRIVDMERRQKQRLEEMREAQKKDEENLNMKDQLRVEIRKELDQVERSCGDMASLLQRLGVHVSSGLFPSKNEVQAAYKKALLKFHPDRASRTDIRRQVEAEEKFKLISRMKEKFSLAG